MDSMSSWKRKEADSDKNLEDFPSVDEPFESDQDFEFDAPQWCDLKADQFRQDPEVQADLWFQKFHLNHEVEVDRFDQRNMAQINSSPSSSESPLDETITLRLDYDGFDDFLDQASPVQEFNHANSLDNMNWDEMEDLTDEIERLLLNARDNEDFAEELPDDLCVPFPSFEKPQPSTIKSRSVERKPKTKTQRVKKPPKRVGPSKENVKQNKISKVTPTAKVSLPKVSLPKKPKEVVTKIDDEVAAMLAEHNRKFSKAIYEPRKYSVKDVKMWEDQTGNKWNNSSPETRQAGNEWIRQHKLLTT